MLRAHVRICMQFSGHGEVDALHSEFYNESSLYYTSSPSLWSSGQSSWLQIQKSQVRFQAVPDFLNSESGMGSTQPREYN
jgi:hypothetical protein